MTQLYIIFFIIGLLIFGAIAGYSWLLKSDWRKKRDLEISFKKKKHHEPLFGDKKNSLDSGVNETETSSEGLDIPLPTKEHENNQPTAKINPDHKLDKKNYDLNANQTSLPVVEMKDDEDSDNINNEKDDIEIADNVEIINAQPKRDKSSSSIVTELVARVKNPEPIEQKDLLVLFRSHDFKFHRQVHIYGLNQLTDMWQDIEFELPSARFVELGVAIQLADRDGSMTDKELHDFQQMALEFSNHFDAPFEFSMDIDEALIQAKVLDQVGRRYDSMAVLNIVPRAKTGFRVADIESCTRDLGMSRSKNGIFLKTLGQKKQISILYRLACTDSSGDFGLSSGNTDSIHDLVMYMNVPATQSPETIFQEMVKDANSLATWLEGKVVDKDGKVMTQRSYSVITQQISDISFSMQQDGLIPGDAVCKKIF